MKSRISQIKPLKFTQICCIQKLKLGMCKHIGKKCLDAKFQPFRMQDNPDIEIFDVQKCSLLRCECPWHVLFGYVPYKLARNLNVKMKCNLEYSHYN